MPSWQRTKDRMAQHPFWISSFINPPKKLEPPRQGRLYVCISYELLKLSIDLLPLGVKYVLWFVYYSTILKYGNKYKILLQLASIYAFLWNHSFLRYSSLCVNYQMFALALTQAKFSPSSAVNYPQQICWKYDVFRPLGWRAIYVAGKSKVSQSKLDLPGYLYRCLHSHLRVVHLYIRLEI